MVPALVLAPEAGEVCLDLCAAPGNKSLQLLEAVAPQGAVLLGQPSGCDLPMIHTHT